MIAEGNLGGGKVQQQEQQVLRTTALGFRGAWLCGKGDSPPHLTPVPLSFTERMASDVANNKVSLEGTVVLPSWVLQACLSQVLIFFMVLIQSPGH